jgi:hypothetical protein
MISMETLEYILSNYKDSGYRSVCMFREADALKIKAEGSSSGFGEYSVYSDTLFVDIDEPDAVEIEALREFFKIQNINYQLFESGKKGVHFHVSTEPLFGLHVMHSHRTWLEHTFPQMNFDFSIYRNNSLIALPGRIHPDTRRPKALLESIDGQTLVVPYVEKQALQINLPDIDQDQGALFSAFTRLSMAILEPPQPGNRHVLIWGVSKALFEGGLEFNTATDIMLAAGLPWGKTEQEILTAVKQAYGIK